MDKTVTNVRQAGEEDKLYDSGSYNNPSIHGVRFCFWGISYLVVLSDVLYRIETAILSLLPCQNVIEGAMKQR